MIKMVHIGLGFYSNLKFKQVYFFDSFAKEPGSRIKKFGNKLLKEFSGGGKERDPIL